MTANPDRKVLLEAPDVRILALRLGGRRRVREPPHQRLGLTNGQALFRQELCDF